MLLYVSMPPAIPVPLSIFYPVLWIPDGHPGPADSDTDPVPDPIYRYPDPEGPKTYGSYGSGIHNTAFPVFFLIPRLSSLNPSS
jgi:hypothetical protein